MKIFLLAFLIGLSGCMTPFKPIETTRMEQFPGLKKEQIFNKSRQWFSETFVSGKSVVDYEDKSAGTIIGKGIVQIEDIFVPLYAHFLMRVDTKDGKIRIKSTIAKYTFASGEYMGSPANPKESDVKRTEEKVKALEAKLFAYIKSGVKKKDW